MSPARGWILGVDIGGTSCSVGAVPVDGAPPRALTVRPTGAEVEAAIDAGAAARSEGAGEGGASAEAAGEHDAGAAPPEELEPASP